MTSASAKPAQAGSLVCDAHANDCFEKIFIAAVRAARLPMLLTDPKQPENPIIFANQAFLSTTGYDAEDVLGRNCRFLQGPATDPDSVARLKLALDKRQGISIELLNFRKDGSSFWNALHVSPIYNSDEELIYFFACQIDMTRQRDTENSVIAGTSLQAVGFHRGKGALLSVRRKGPAIAALRRWREMERFASGAEYNLARQELAQANTASPGSLAPERLFAKQLRDAATRARIEAFEVLDNIGGADS
jgi:PAS domain S-box-containing protein